MDIERRVQEYLAIPYPLVQDRPYLLVFVAEFLTLQGQPTSPVRHEETDMSFSTLGEAEEWVETARSDWFIGDLDFQVIEWTVVATRDKEDQKNILHFRRRGEDGRTFDILREGRPIGEAYPAVGGGWEATTPPGECVTVSRSRSLRGAAYGLIGEKDSTS